MYKNIYFCWVDLCCDLDKELWFEEKHLKILNPLYQSLKIKFSTYGVQGHPEMLFFALT